MARRINPHLLRQLAARGDLPIRVVKPVMRALLRVLRAHSQGRPIPLRVRRTPYVALLDLDNLSNRDLKTLSKLSGQPVEMVARVVAGFIEVSDRHLRASQN